MRGVHKRRYLMMGTICTLTAAEWAVIKARFKNQCVYCGAKDKPLTRDHIVPLSQGGHHTAKNVVPACRGCNSRKNAKPLLIQMLATSG